ncbi:MAG: magnesium transporter [Candidatus Riflebacteria bacterium]|nr:magnesium transporter [Candidatus Riflebacteria bacterium]
MSDHNQLLQELQSLIASKNAKAILQITSKYKAPDIAGALLEIDLAEAAVIFRLLPKKTAAKVYVYLPSEAQAELIRAYSEKEMAELTNLLYMDDLADLLEELPANIASRILENATPEKRKMLNVLLQYPQDSAGSVMTVEYVNFRKTMKVKDAIQKLRNMTEPAETLYTTFVTDKNRRLEGTVSLKYLLTSHDNQTIGEIMYPFPLSVSTHDDILNAAKLLKKYDLNVLPVTDSESRLVGIITIDDALDAVTAQTTREFAKRAAVKPTDKPYLEAGIYEQAKHRLPWLGLLMISGTINEAVINGNSKLFVAVPILVSFIPMLTGTGGNAGAQASGLLIRGIALEEVEFKDILKVIWMEIRVGVLIGFVLALVNLIRLQMQGDPAADQVKFPVSVALILTVILSKIIGGSLPLLAKKIGLDPAVMAVPLITTLVDFLTLAVYFSVAALML